MLGHLAKHDVDFRDTTMCFDPIKTYWIHKECQANAFALNLLMPSREVFRYGETILSEYMNMFEEKMSKNTFLQVMAKSFMVPASWMQMRLRRFGVR